VAGGRYVRPVHDGDQPRHLAVGAGASPIDPDLPADGAEDVVQAVADFVDDLVDDEDPPADAEPAT
jgi:hypothetical protein